MAQMVLNYLICGNLTFKVSIVPIKSLNFFIYSNLVPKLSKLQLTIKFLTHNTRDEYIVTFESILER